MTPDETSGGKRSGHRGYRTYTAEGRPGAPPTVPPGHRPGWNPPDLATADTAELDPAELLAHRLPTLIAIAEATAADRGTPAAHQVLAQTHHLATRIHVTT